MCAPRLAVWVLLNSNPQGVFTLLAVVCTSFSAVNVATSKRSPATPMGDCSLPYVRDTWFQYSINDFDYTFCLNPFNFQNTDQEGNNLLSRAILICMLVVALGGVFLVEQPASSRLPWYPRWENFVRKIKMWRCGWWAMQYGALTPSLGLITIWIVNLICHFFVCMG